MSVKKPFLSVELERHVVADDFTLVPGKALPVSEVNFQEVSLLDFAFMIGQLVRAVSSTQNIPEPDVMELITKVTEINKITGSVAVNVIQMKRGGEEE